MTESDHPAPHDEIAIACRVLHDAGQSDNVWGHVSIRDSEGRGAWIKANNLGFDEVTPSDVILLSWEGEILEGSGGRHLEWPIHLEIMRRRPDVGGVVHTHPMYAIAFAATGWPMRAISNDGSCFVPPDIPRFSRTGSFVRTPELGAALADCLGERNAALMPRHGVVTAAPSLGEAVALAVNLERACQLALLAGENGAGSPDDEASAKGADMIRTLHMQWGYLRRRAVNGRRDSQSTERA